VVVGVLAVEVLVGPGSVLVDGDDAVVVESVGTTTVIGAPLGDAAAPLVAAGLTTVVAATGDGAAVVAVVQAVPSSATASPAAMTEPRMNRRVSLTPNHLRSQSCRRVGRTFSRRIAGGPDFTRPR